MTPTLTSNPDVAVDRDYFLQPMSTCPVAVKVQLENPGGVLTYSSWDGKDPQWLSWAPLPKRQKDSA